MKTLSVTIGQTVLLLILGLAVGLGVNTVRGKDRINLSRNYFPPRPIATPPSTAPAPAPDEETQVTKTQPTEPESPFRAVELKEVLELFEHPNAALGVHVFIDARADEPYLEGHIPGALQCDHYRLEDYLPNVLSIAAAAETIVVYCNGGDCEDSLSVCGDLMLADVPRARILLFKGGWQEWLKAGLPQTTGREQ
jgi:rhodanese-related sulfurtransferase